MSSTPKVAIYVRQSVNSDEGIARGLASCRRLAKARKWKVLAEFQDNAVSRKEGRDETTEWQRLLDGIDAGTFDTVVSVAMDRLLGSQHDLLELTKRNVTILTVQGDLDLTTPAGRMVAQNLTAFAEFELGNKKERTVRANVHRVEGGRPPIGRANYGWKKDGISLEPAEAKWVKWMHKELLKGASIHGIVRELNAKGVRSKLDKDWSMASVRKALLRPRNAGHLYYKGILQPLSLVTPIVSDEDHKLVLSILNSPDRMMSKGPNPEVNWLSGVLVCDVCKEPMYQRAQGKAGQPKTRYYICKSMISKATVRTKKHSTIVAHIAEGKVLASLYGHYSAGWIRAGESNKKEIKAARKRLAKINEERTSATDLLLTPGIDGTRVKVRLAELGAEGESTQREIDRLVASGFAGTWLEDLNTAGEDSTESAEAWLEWWNSVEIKKRRAVIRSAFDIRVTSGGRGASRVEVEPKAP